MTPYDVKCGMRVRWLKTGAVGTVTLLNKRRSVVTAARVKMDADEKMHWLPPCELAQVTEAPAAV